MKTEINIYTALVILFFHWICDFVLQTDEQAKGKSKAFDPLLVHTSNYSVALGMALWVYLYLTGGVASWASFDRIIQFIGMTGICHTIQDYFTSRLNAKLYSQGKTHLFFVSIGLDQFIHFVQLLLCYQMLIVI